MRITFTLTSHIVHPKELGHGGVFGLREDDPPRVAQVLVRRLQRQRRQARQASHRRVGRDRQRLGVLKSRPEPPAGTNLKHISITNYLIH